jgi:hypothetical protein
MRTGLVRKATERALNLWRIVSSAAEPLIVATPVRLRGTCLGWITRLGNWHIRLGRSVALDAISWGTLLSFAKSCRPAGASPHQC